MHIFNIDNEEKTKLTEIKPVQWSNQQQVMLAFLLLRLFQPQYLLPTEQCNILYSVIYVLNNACEIIC